MKYLREIVQLDELGANTLTRYLTKTPEWGRKELDKKNPDYDKVGKRAYWQKVAKEKLEKKGFKVRYPNEETELDEAKRTPYKRKGSLRSQVKSQADIAKEKTERRKAMRGV